MNYKVLYINDRFGENVRRSQSILNDAGFSLCDIASFNGKEQNPYEELAKRDIRIWSEKEYINYYGVTAEHGYRNLSSGRASHWLSYLNVWEYIYKNKIDNFLLLEDDAFLNDNFLSVLNGSMNELPKNYDFLSLFITRRKQLKIDGTIPGKKYIEDCISQRWATLGTVFSYQMAGKMLGYVKKYGIGLPTDDTIFSLANKKSFLNGFKTRTDLDDVILNLDEFKKHTTIEYTFIS